MKKIKTEFAGNDGWTAWIQPVKRGYLMACCDCGLVHRMDFRVVEGRAQFRASRAPAYTAKQRKKIGSAPFKHFGYEPAWSKQLLAGLKKIKWVSRK